MTKPTTHNLVQGSPEWLAYRAQHDNASDAPAMMGCSAYKTRSELLHERHTGLTPDVDAGTQRRFDDGHRFEALARPLAEAIIGDDLYPVVLSLGRLSASYDGLTMAGDVGFEHKSLNAELRSAFADMATLAPEFRDSAANRSLPLMYRVQMEQQLMIAQASRILFMASKWDGDTLVEESHCWYTPDAELRAQILAGWAQFHEDLADYVPTLAVVEAVGHTPQTLPALRIEVTGMVTASNLSDYKAHALAVFAGINRELTTDQQFADADKVVKWCGDVEVRLAAAKQHALSQTESIDALFRTIDDISAEARRVRLELDKLVKARKEAVRGEIVAEGVAALRAHIEALNTQLGLAYIARVAADFGGAVRGLRTVASQKNAVDTELARAKIEADAMAGRIQANLAQLHAAADLDFLFTDTARLVLLIHDDLAVVILARMTEYRRKEAVRIENAAARVEDAAARIKAQAEQHADAAARAAAAIAQAAAAPPAAARSAAPADAPVDALAGPESESESESVLTLGQLNARIGHGFSMSAEFLRALGFEPAERDKKRPNAVLYREHQFVAILSALVEHFAHLARDLQTA